MLGRYVVIIFCYVVVSKYLGFWVLFVLFLKYKKFCVVLYCGDWVLC